MPVSQECLETRNKESNMCAIFSRSGTDGERRRVVDRL